jgi:hypothetical protein
MSVNYGKKLRKKIMKLDYRLTKEEVGVIETVC